ncbi:hypothetical protein ACOME3_001580 [Neoechinorhynchus agilis]
MDHKPGKKRFLDSVSKDLRENRVKPPEKKRRHTVGPIRRAKNVHHSYTRLDDFTSSSKEFLCSNAGVLFTAVISPRPSATRLKRKANFADNKGCYFDECDFDDCKTVKTFFDKYCDSPCVWRTVDELNELVEKLDLEPVVEKNGTDPSALKPNASTVSNEFDKLEKLLQNFADSASLCDQKENLPETEIELQTNDESLSALTDNRKRTSIDQMIINDVEIEKKVRIKDLDSAENERLESKSRYSVDTDAIRKKYELKAPSISAPKYGDKLIELLQTNSKSSIHDELDNEKFKHLRFMQVYVVDVKVGFS